jgi:hypothetical protein
VTFNSEKLIREVLDSITCRLPLDYNPCLYIVDNNSTDRTTHIAEEFARRYPNIKLILNSQNFGFGKAHNQVIEAVNSRYHVVCNPDILLSGDIFTPLVKFMECWHDIGIVCPKFLNIDGTIQSLNRNHPTVLDLFLRRFLPSSFRPFLKKRLAAYEMQDVGYEKSYDVPFVSGAFMFCRTDILKAVGGFDERYFLYFEDADLSRKLQIHGYRTVFWPHVTVTHAWERLAHKSLLGSLMFAQSAYQYFQKWGFKWW